MYIIYVSIRRDVYLRPYQSRVTEVEQQCRVQLTTMEAETAQLKQEREVDAVAAAKRVEGQQTLSFCSAFVCRETKYTCTVQIK